MATDSEMAVCDLKNFGGDRPGIVVVQAVDQCGKGLDVCRQPRKTEDRSAIRNRKIAVRSKQIRIPVADIGQEQDRRERRIKTLKSKCSDHSVGVSDDFRLHYSEKAASVVESLLSRRGSVFFRKLLWFGRRKGLAVDRPIIGQKGLLRSFNRHGDGRPVEIRIQNQKKLIGLRLKRRRDQQREEKYYSAVEFAVCHLSRTSSIQNHDILS